MGVLSWCDVDVRSAVHSVFWGEIQQSDVLGVVGWWVCLVWSLLVLVVDLSIVATSPPDMPNLPRLRLYDLLGRSVGWNPFKSWLRADRTGRYPLHLPTIQTILPFFWVFDFTNYMYLCWCSLYTVSIAQTSRHYIRITHTQLIAGKCVANRNRVSFNVVGADMCLEQTINRAQTIALVSYRAHILRCTSLNVSSSIMRCFLCVIWARSWVDSDIHMSWLSTMDSHVKHSPQS